MTDIADEAAEREQQLIALALASRIKPIDIFTGKCLWCDAAIRTGQFCDTDCRDDYEHYQKAQSQKLI